MIKFLIILCILLTAVIVLSVWGYTLLSKRFNYVFNYVFNNHEVLYLKMLETEIVTVSMYLKMLETAYQEAVRKGQYEVAGVINDTLKHNSRTLQELRQECDVIQRKRQSPR